MEKKSIKKNKNWRMCLFPSPIFQDKKQKLYRKKIKLNIVFTLRFCVKYVVEEPKYKYTTIYCMIRGYLEWMK